MLADIKLKKGLFRKEQSLLNYLLKEVSKN